MFMKKNLLLLVLINYRILLNQGMHAKNNSHKTYYKQSLKIIIRYIFTNLET